MASGRSPQGRSTRAGCTTKPYRLSGKALCPEILVAALPHRSHHQSCNCRRRPCNLRHGPDRPRVLALKAWEPEDENHATPCRTVRSRGGALNNSSSQNQEHASWSCSGSRECSSEPARLHRQQERLHPQTGLVRSPEPKQHQDGLARSVGSTWPTLTMLVDCQRIQLFGRTFQLDIVAGECSIAGADRTKLRNINSAAVAGYRTTRRIGAAVRPLEQAWRFTRFDRAKDPF